MKPELIKHLTDSELMLCHLYGVNDKETAALVRAFHKEHEKRDRIPTYKNKFGITRNYVNEHWECGY